MKKNRGKSQYRRKAQANKKNWKWGKCNRRMQQKRNNIQVKANKIQLKKNTVPVSIVYSLQKQVYNCITGFKNTVHSK